MQALRLVNATFNQIDNLGHRPAVERRREPVRDAGRRRRSERVDDRSGRLGAPAP
jgi:hypothetical protein